MGRALSVQEDTRGLNGSFANPSINAAKESTAAPVPQRRDISPVQNVMSFRRSFPDLWAEYLLGRYHTAYAVQRAFPGIDSHTARDWISGSFVATVIARDPSAIEILGRTE